jgi:outer membrane receptor protein involved in Fe transport
VFDDRDETLDRIYLYWTPAQRWGVSAEAVYDKFESDGSLDLNYPSKVKTVSFPVQVQYFHPSGAFVGLGVTYVEQDVRRDSSDALPPESRLGEGNSYFSVVDLGVGYRLPKRRGIASVSVQNLFDEDFDYQDDSYREFKDEPSTGPYIPERVFMGRLTLNF